MRRCKGRSWRKRSRPLKRSINLFHREKKGFFVKPRENFLFWKPESLVWGSKSLHVIRRGFGFRIPAFPVGNVKRFVLSKISRFWKESLHGGRSVPNVWLVPIFVPSRQFNMENRLWRKGDIIIPICGKKKIEDCKVKKRKWIRKTFSLFYLIPILEIKNKIQF